MTLRGWIDDVTDHVARARGLDPETLRVSRQEAGVILDVARIAAHASGARTNAPLLSYALGKAAAATGLPLTELAADVRALTGDPDQDAAPARDDQDARTPAGDDEDAG